MRRQASVKVLILAIAGSALLVFLLRTLRPEGDSVSSGSPGLDQVAAEGGADQPRPVATPEPTPPPQRVVFIGTDNPVGELRIRQWPGEGRWKAIRPPAKVAADRVDLPEGVELGLFASEEGSADLSSLAALGPDDLQAFIATRTRITDEQLEYLTGFRSLREIYLGYNSRITGAALDYLKEIPSLQSLTLNNTRITNKGLAGLKHISSLRFLDLSGTRINDAGLENLAGLSALESLSLNSTQITGVGVAKLAELLPSLRFLQVARTNLTDSAMIHLGKLKLLEEILLDGTRVTYEGKKRLQDALPDTRIRFRIRSPQEAKPSIPPIS